jgi:hypothetical protein
LASTYEAYRQFDGRRATRFAGLQEACDTLDGLPCSDLTSVLTIMSDERAADVTAGAVVNGNRFHEPSTVSQRDYHWMEGLILRIYPEDIDVVELSPLQPFGTNKLLADTNQKNVVSTARGSEANADIATALFRVAVQRYDDRSNERIGVTVAANARLVRAQMYKNPKFLPHFRMFGEVTVADRGEELDYLAEHFGRKVDIITAIADSKRSRIDSVNISLGNLALLHDLIQRGLVDADELRNNIRDPNYNLIADQCLDIPEYLPLDAPDIVSILKGLGFKRGVGLMANMKLALERKRPDLVPVTRIHLGRTAANGYYNHICFDINASNAAGDTFPVAGGGSTDWALKAGRKKGIATVVSTVSTDQLCRNLITPMIKQ